MTIDLTLITSNSSGGQTRTEVDNSTEYKDFHIAETDSNNDNFQETNIQKYDDDKGDMYLKINGHVISGVHLETLIKFINQ